MENQVESKTTTEILERLVRLETKLDDFNSLREKVDNDHNMVSRHEKELETLKSNNTWLNRLVLGAIFLGILNAVIKFN